MNKNITKLMKLHDVMFEIAGYNKFHKDYTFHKRMLTFLLTFFGSPLVYFLYNIYLIEDITSKGGGGLIIVVLSSILAFSVVQLSFYLVAHYKLKSDKENDISKDVDNAIELIYAENDIINQILDSSLLPFSQRIPEKKPKHFRAKADLVNRVLKIMSLAVTTTDLSGKKLKKSV